MLQYQIGLKNESKGKKDEVSKANKINVIKMYQLVSNELYDSLCPLDMKINQIHRGLFPYMEAREEQTL